MKENLHATGCFLWWVIIGLLVIAAATAVYYVALPAMVHRETEAARSSYGYVQTKQTQVIALLTDYQKVGNTLATLDANDARKPGLEAQQQSDVDQMRVAVALMKPQDVPPSVAAFLAGVGQ